MPPSVPPSNTSYSAVLAVVLAAVLLMASCSSSTEVGAPDPASTPSSPAPTEDPVGEPGPTEVPVEVPTESIEPTAVPTATPVPEPVSPPQALAVCAANGTDREVNVRDNDLDELSGAVFSVINENVLWAHNDSGDEPVLWALDPETGKKFDTIELDEIDNVDWEDIAVGPGPGGQSYLYIADFGDNAGARESVTIYRMLEPTVESTHISRNGPAEEITLTYPSRIADAEALLVDPWSGDLVIVTKRFGGGAAEIMYVPAPGAGDQELEMIEVAQVDLSQFDVNPLATQTDGGLAVTAGDVSPAGDVVVIRTYGTILAFPREPGTELWTAMLAEPCEAPSAIEAQGEAIALGLDRYVTISEGVEPLINEFAYERAPEA